VIAAAAPHPNAASTNTIRFARVPRTPSDSAASSPRPPMLDVECGRPEPSTGPSDELQLELCESYEHSGEPVDFAYSRYALHHLPGFWKAHALVRLSRFMRPGAVLRLWDVVYSFQPGETEQRIESWCATGGTNMETDWSRAELEEHVRDEHSTFTWLLEPIIERAGFRIDDADYSPDGIFARYVARRR